MNDDPEFVENKLVLICKLNGAKEDFTVDDSDIYNDGMGMTYHYFIYTSNPSYDVIAKNIDIIDEIASKYNISVTIDEDDDGNIIAEYQAD